MSLFLGICCLCGAVQVALVYWTRLDEAEALRERRVFVAWAVKGLGVPVLSWLVFNSGWVPGLPTLLPQLEAARSGKGPWLGLYLDLTAGALFVIASYWCAVTLAWLVRLELMRLDKWVEFGLLAGFWSLLLLPAGALIIRSAGWGAAGLAAAAWLAPIVHGLPNLRAAPKRPPTYSRALAKLKLGKFNEAEWEVIRELETCENDFDGWMMLAELYAVHFHDLPAAEKTICDLCSQPEMDRSQVAVALHRLADWYLKFEEDPLAARCALEAICRRYPDTHLAYMARQRLDQLPATREALQQQHEGRRIRLPALRSNLEEAPAPAGARETSRAEAAAVANRLVERLKQDPNDVPAREEVARVLAEQLDQPDLGIEQMNLLLGLPGQPDGRRAEWLASIATWQIRYQQDSEAAQATLERLVHDHPQSPQAFTAQRRLFLMAAEARLRRARGAKP
jgi:hypothetical protein